MNPFNRKTVFTLNIIDNVILIGCYSFLVGIQLNSIPHFSSSLVILIFFWNYFSTNLKINKKIFFDNLIGLWKSVVKMYLFLTLILICFKLLNESFQIYKLLLFVNVFVIVKILVSSLVIFSVRYLLRVKNKFRKVIIVGDIENATRLVKYLKCDLHVGYKVEKEIILDKSKNDISEKSRQIDETITSTPDLDEVIFVTPFELSYKTKDLIDLCDFQGINIKYMPCYSFMSIKNQSFEVEMFGKIPLMNFRQYQSNNEYSLFYKRIFDILFSLVFLGVFSPLYILISILILIDSKGTIFYKPVRLGRNRKEFKMYKFRTMKINDDPRNGQKSTELNDARITKIGRFLRKTNIDEIPQFLNVLKGDMSVVGPRPHRIFLTNEFKSQINNYMLRHYCKPGITGWAQVNGWRGPTKSIEQKSERTRHDLYYVENRNMLFDLKIIWLTIFARKSFKNAF